MSGNRQKFAGSLIGVPFLASIDRSGSRLNDKTHCAYIVNGYQVPMGYQAYLLGCNLPSEFAKNLATYCPKASILYDIDGLDELDEYDVVEVSQAGRLCIAYKDSSDDNVLFITNKCNSNCIMCPDSNTNRRAPLGRADDYLFNLADLIPSDTRHLTLTGGEPTLLKWDLIQLLSKCREKFTNTDFLMLSNGRAFCIKEYRDAFLEAVPYSFCLGVPLYASNADEHDAVTRARGSFLQTVSALKILQYRIDVELRIVVLKQNYQKIPEIVKYICKELPNVKYVCIMGIELMGNAAVSRENLWVDYAETAPYLEVAAATLFSAGIEAKIYNYPLCSLPRHLWNLAERSITDYKIRYKDECCNCAVKDICGGFFFSTMHFEETEVHPVMGVDDKI